MQARQALGKPFVRNAPPTCPVPSVDLSWYEKRRKTCNGLPEGGSWHRSRFLALMAGAATLYKFREHP